MVEPVSGTNGPSSTPASEWRPPMKAPEQKIPMFEWQQSTGNKGTEVERTAQPDEAKKPEKKEDTNVKPTPHKVNKGFYAATQDKNSKISGKDGILANNGEKIRKSDDPAGTVADAVISTKSYTAETAQMKNQVRQMIIAANPSVFEKDGSLKKDKDGKVIADLGKLDLPTRTHLQATLDKADPKRTVIPKGFYPAFGDKNASINGLTESEIRQNEGKKGEETCGAVQVLNALLKTKGAHIMASGERKAALLNDLVRKNPSVFDEDGKVKKDADFSKLDVPSLDYMAKAYGKLPYKSSKPVVIARNGAYAVGTGKEAKFYLANGKEISAAAFKKNCPSIYKSVTGEA
ncbi:MAG: hypothetical protein ACI37Q_04025 [Candidatus Gastranaerophilaceae bacterium]